MDSFGKFCFAIIILTISTIIAGFVFLTLWKWFVIPPFHLPAISLTQAIGLMFTLRFLKGMKKDDGKKDMEETIKDLKEDFKSLIVYTGLVLVIGWIIFQFT